jgi:spoIIIJ-associated protein
VDVNEYQKKHIEEIRSKARILAERARYFKSSVDMEPMSAYERMIIHSEFASSPDISTESIGKGKDRHVVLRYTENKTLS